MKRLFWFVVSILSIVFLVSFFSTLSLVWGPDEGFTSKDSNIGVIEIEGMIQGSMGVLEQIRDFNKNENLKAMIVRVDSPGGAVGASQEIFLELKKLKERVPVVISMGNLAASGGLYISLGGSHVFALPGTLTGSMGVLTTITNFSKLLDKAYIDPITLKSGNLKDAGNPTEPMDPKAQAFLQEMINLTFEQFKEDVAKERELKPEVVKLISDGRVLIGKQAKELGLVDEMGGFLDAVSYAQSKAGIEGEPKLAFLSRKPKGLVEKLIEGTSAQIVSFLQTRWGGLQYLLSPNQSGTIGTLGLE